MSTLTQQVKMIVETDRKQHAGYEIVEIHTAAIGPVPKVYRYGDRLPLFNFLKTAPGYTVNMQPIAVPFDAAVTSQRGLPYRVQGQLVCRCTDAAVVAQEFHRGLDPLAALCDRLSQRLQESSQHQVELTPNACRALLFQPHAGAILVENVDDIAVSDQSTRFKFWLHMPEVTLAPISGGHSTKSALRPTSQVTSADEAGTERLIRVRVPARSQGTDTSTATGKIKIVSSRTTDTPHVKVVGAHATPGEAAQDPPSVFDQTGLELTRVLPIHAAFRRRNSFPWRPFRFLR